MTPLPYLLDSAGRPFPLERLLASGGEGTVFTLPQDHARVAKVYHKPPSAQTSEKLAVMVGLGNPRLAQVAAWPNSLLLDARTRVVAGFTMPRLNDYQMIQQLYNPVMRLKHFPQCGWNFQVRAAINTAAAFDEVHKAGCLVGDVNQSNVQVSRQALVRLIDCDSFQVRTNGKQYLCEVGVPHYTSPELQGKSFRGLVRTENHDRFGLAVLIYQLLFVGRHPYAGVFRGKGDPSFEELIAQFRFAQGPNAHSWDMNPPPHTPTFSDIPSDVGLLFRRAFERGSELGTRPAPMDWIRCLTQLEQATADCAVDPGHKYWRGQSKCVWCRLAEKGGPEYYFGVAGGASTFDVDETKLQVVLQRLAAVRVREFHYERERYAPVAPFLPKPLPDDLGEQKNTTTILAIAFAISVAMMPLGLVRGYICAIGFISALVFGLWFTLIWAFSPWQSERRKRQIARSSAEEELLALEEEWEVIQHRYRSDHKKIGEAIYGMVSECRGLLSYFQSDLQRLSADAEVAARERHLRLHSIVDADIPKIGTGRKQILSSHGISTAADVEWNLIRNINGFGDALTSNVIAWREEVLRQFRFDARTGVSPAEQLSLAVRFRVRQQEILGNLQQTLIELESLSPSCQTALKRMEPELKRVIAAWKQADADFHFVVKKRKRK